MGKPVANGTAAVAPAKPAGIRIIRSVKPAPGENGTTNVLTKPGVSPKSPAPVQKSGDEIWADVLSQSEGDIPTAISVLIERLTAASAPAAAAIAAAVDYVGVPALSEHGLYDAILAALEAEEKPARCVALKTVEAITKTCGKSVEPLLLSLMPTVLLCGSDKVAANSAAASTAGMALVEGLNPHATRSIINILFEGMAVGKKWQSRVLSLNLLAARCKRCQVEAGHCVLSMMPILSGAIVDSRLEVAEAAHAALLACCYTAGNRDLEPHVPIIVSCIARPQEVSDVVAKLSGTTFVQTMEDASLAVLAPLMQRALRERSTKTQRRASIIIENMSKLVMDPADARPFLPLLVPALDVVAQEAADPELREVAGRAHEALERIKKASDEVEAKAGHAADSNAVLKALNEACAASAPSADLTTFAAQAAVAYVADLGASLITSHLHGPRSWEGCIAPYMTPILDGEEETGKAVSVAVRRWALTHMGEVVTEEEDVEDELCNCEFSLAYGGRILLTGATLRLRRGKRYGLCGANGAGKSTLMRAIARGQLDGFPPKEELRTVYVEHDIDASEEDVNSVDWIFEDAVVQEAVSPSREDVAAALTSVGFSQELQNSPILSLSGGWKMKLALARAMLLKADILLLDEPTNHLDTTNVEWLQNYLTSMPDVSSMIVSHDSGFLDAVCTDIIHYESRKLVLYPGNLSEFVKVKPEAKSYYELAAVSFKFMFPDPGFLDGIKGKTQSVMRMTNVGFAYPGAAKKQLENVTLRTTLGSRIAVLGRNGAGKSTLIKLLTGEMEPNEGKVWKHPNLRVAYVAQHAFHHIEEHLENTPAEYFWWRFGDGEDREAKEKVTRKVTPEEQAARDAAIARGERVVDYLNSRRMSGKTKEYEYEVCWVGQSQRENVWLSRTELCEKRGLSKMVEDVDAKLAMFRNYRALSTPVVLSHLKDFGLEEEISAHNRIRGLSGGQKVKLVLAAAMWCQPHVLVLDEPTNYLDRDSLGALAAGINEFNGGVIMISHNSEFTSALCREEWLVGDGKVVIKGAPAPSSVGGLSAVPSMASLASVSSVTSLSTLADSEENYAEMDPEKMEEDLKLKAFKRADKERIAAEKAAKKAERAKLKFARKF
jgi:elongation factor 3